MTRRSVVGGPSLSLFVKMTEVIADRQSQDLLTMRIRDVFSEAWRAKSR